MHTDACTHSILLPTPRQVVACTGLALCALHSLSLDKAAEHCASGLRAVRMTMATSQVRVMNRQPINQLMPITAIVFLMSQINSLQRLRLV